jgi:hypoxanthine phosphoribosyltransferase
MTRVTLKDRTFDLFIPNERITAAIADVAAIINADYADKDTPVFLGILNGSFMFMGELMHHINFTCEVSFLKIASYSGTHSSGSIKDLIGLAGELDGRHVIVVEDIVDTGESIEHVMNILAGKNPASVEVATLLMKPAAYTKKHYIKYRAMEIPNDFIVGFGLDYDQLGRNLTDIYKVVDE